MTFTSNGWVWIAQSGEDEMGYTGLPGLFGGSTAGGSTQGMTQGILQQASSQQGYGQQLSSAQNQFQYITISGGASWTQIILSNPQLAEQPKYAAVEELEEPPKRMIEVL